MHKVKNFILNMVRRLLFGHKSTSERYIAWLRKQGVTVGEHTHFYTPWEISVDTQRPWMIEIGDNVHITMGCTILQHGYDWAVLQKKYGEVFGSCGKVKIGNNVFIGQKSIILKGAQIGDNVIIGAGSLVSKPLAANAVYAGVPARRIMSMDEYREKRKQAQFEEAKSLVTEYRRKYGENPKKELLREFFWLFEPRNGELCQTFKDVHSLDNNDAVSVAAFKKSQPLFDGYDAFLAACGSI